MELGINYANIMVVANDHYLRLGNFKILEELMKIAGGSLCYWIMNNYSSRVMATALVDTCTAA